MEMIYINTVGVKTKLLCIYNILLPKYKMHNILAFQNLFSTKK